MKKKPKRNNNKLHLLRSRVSNAATKFCRRETKQRRYFASQPDKRLIQVEIVELLTHVNIIKEKLDL